MTPNNFSIEPSPSRAQHRAQATLGELDTLRHKCSYYGEQAYLAFQRREQLQQTLKNLVNDNPKFGYPRTRDVIRHFCLGLLVLGSWVISLVLIYSPAEYLIQKNLGENNPFVGVSIVLLTMVLTLGQVSVAILYFDAKQTTTMLRPWRFVATIMALFTAGMMVATEIARYVGLERWPWPHDLIGLALQMGLAFAFDALIVCNGEALESALGFAWFSMQHNRLQRTCNSLLASFHRHMAEVRLLYTLYQQKLSIYYKNAGEDADPPSPFDDTTQWVLNEWLGTSKSQVS
ncbi:MAG: hypothetical protein AAGE59_03375 [Cyanobacteria bacterium P01_F01_bin.86]